MNISDLEIQLDKLHVPKDIYNLKGEFIPERTVLYNSGSNWIIVSIDERGNKSDELIFGSETQACEYLFERYSKWYNYNDRDLSRIVALLNKRPQFGNKNIFYKNILNVTNFKFPTTLMRFYDRYDGAEGFVGKNVHIKILQLDLLLEVNRKFWSKYFFNDYFLFALESDLVLYGFKLNTEDIYEVELNNNEEDCNIKFCANGFDNFLFFLFDK